MSYFMRTVVTVGVSKLRVVFELFVEYISYGIEWFSNVISFTKHWQHFEIWMVLHNPWSKEFKNHELWYELSEYRVSADFHMAQMMLRILTIN